MTKDRSGATTTTATDSIPGWKGELDGVDHYAVRVPELDAAVDWYTTVFGLHPRTRNADRVYMASPVTGKIVIALTAADGPGLDYVSYRVRDRDRLEIVASRLREVGIAYTSGIENSRPGALEALRIDLPTGHSLELLLAEEVDGEDAELHAGALDVRTSHLQFRTPDPAAMAAWLEPVGFRTTAYDDNAEHPIRFIRTNELHHQMAILGGEAGIHHVAVELDTPDFWKFLDHLSRVRVRAEYGPGRHHEGNLLFVYVRDPFGNRTEITSEMQRVGDDYPPTFLAQEPWFHMNMWGPQPPMSWYTEWN